MKLANIYAAPTRYLALERLPFQSFQKQQ